MLRVTPIGSCRIAGPLQRAQDRLGIASNKGRVYGYCHSSGEAVQMARFLQGDFIPKANIWPLISRGTALASLTAQTHDPSDLYMIELSSTKRLTVDGVFVQLNYVTNAFAHFFADENRARAFWVRAEDGNQIAIDRFLSTQPVTEADRAILRLLRLSMTTPEELRADIATLQTLLPRILIVTHANARKPDGMPISTRAAFIDMVKQAARTVGARVYDPTKRMLEMGQAHALADHSAGLAHYTDGFADALCDDWVDAAIAPAIDDLVHVEGAPRVADTLTPHMAALTGRVPFAALEARLSTLTNGGADVVALSASVQSAKHKMQPGDDPIHAAYLLGQWDQLITRLTQSDTSPTADCFLTYAKSAPIEPARQILLQGLTVHPQANMLADRVVPLLLDASHDCLTPIPKALRQTLLTLVTPVQRVQLCMAYGWNLQIVAQDLSADDVAEVATHLALIKDHKTALMLIGRWLANNDMPSQLSTMLGKWCQRPATDGQTTVTLCRQVLAIDPQNAGARLALRDIRRAIRADMRRMSKTPDQAGLEELAQVNALLPDPLPEVDLFRARACFGAGDYEGAIRIGRAAAEVLPDNISIWVLLMRAAHRVQQTSLSARFAAQVIALSTPDTSRFAKEAANRIGDSALVPHD